MTGIERKRLRGLAPGLIMGMAPRMASWVALFCLLGWTLPGSARAEIPIIDAHSQVDFNRRMDRIIELMDKGGVSRTLLATRRKGKLKALLALAEKYPNRITPSVRSKSRKFEKNDPAYIKLVKKQMKLGGFGAMAEVLMYHAEKFNRNGFSIANEVVVFPDDPRVRTLFKIAERKRWPFVMHIEFGASGDHRAELMTRMKRFVAAYPNYPFALIHMGQLEAGDVGRLIQAHPNLYFLTAHTTRYSSGDGRYPFVDIFSGETLAREWKALVVRYPKRFVMAFDNVWEVHWGEFYLNQIKLWRKALDDLPPNIAHALAHRNAERLWRLPPLK